VAKDAEVTAALRGFNRFYTPIIGALSRGYLDTPHSLQEARIIYEVATHPGCTAKDIRSRVGFDQGYMSRLVARLERQGILSRTTSAHDGRVHELYLSAKGTRAFRQLDQRADGQVKKLVTGLARADQQALTRALATIQRILGDEPTTDPATIRQGRVGDLGLCFHRQVVAYKQEFGFTDVFETYFAQGLPVFLERYDPARDRVWVAESGGRPVGWVAIHHADDRPGWAKLRWFFVEKDARGGGLGAKLLRRAVEFSQRGGYKGVFLWTVSTLDAARRLYERAGFTLAEETDDCPWDRSAREQRWDLRLPRRT
jgi:DNA-binding MarR family transcriptional regulator/GNAT superfamily N-acetyltransferase